MIRDLGQNPCRLNLQPIFRMVVPRPRGSLDEDPINGLWNKRHRRHRTPVRKLPPTRQKNSKNMGIRIHPIQQFLQQQIIREKNTRHHLPPPPAERFLWLMREAARPTQSCLQVYTHAGRHAHTQSERGIRTYTLGQTQLLREKEALKSPPPPSNACRL